MMPIVCRRRYMWGDSVFLDTTGTSFSVPAGEVLPGDFKERRWALAEVRGYRAATTAIAQAAVISAIRVGDGFELLPPGKTGEGLGVESQSGVIPLWIPLPADWSGSLEVDAASDNGASLTFRFMFSFVELTETEAGWDSCGGGA